MKNKKSIGISNSPLVQKLENSSPSETLRSEIENFQTNSRPIGFLPSYTSNATNINDCPPYPIDCRVHIENVPPHPLDEYTHGNNLPLYRTKLINFQISEEPSNLQFFKPSAPTIQEIDNKIGLTNSEREEIINLLLRMKQIVNEATLSTTETEMKEFSNARQKLQNLLHATQAKLSKEDKNEFLTEAQKIIEMKNEKSKILKEELYCDCLSIVFKTIIFDMILVSCGINNCSSKVEDYYKLRYILPIAILISVSFLIFSKKNSIMAFFFEFLLCIICFLEFVDTLKPYSFSYLREVFYLPLIVIGCDISRIIWKYST